MKISIIVPVYKVEKEIERCIKSILTQSFTDFELILVDDGSPDSSGLICDEWAEKDGRIQVIHKANGGLSDARNAGIDIARGEYIGFVDSDDYIHERMYEILFEIIKQYNADIAMCGFKDVYPGRKGLDDDKEKIYVWNREEAIYNILLGKLVSVHAPTKLYKRELFDNVRYKKGIVSEDSYIIMDIMKNVETAVLTTKKLYYYVHRINSINTSKYTPLDLTRIEGHYKNFLYISKAYPNMKDIAYERYLAANVFVINKAIMSNSGLSSREIQECISIVRKNCRYILKGCFYRKRKKVLILLMISNIKLYRTIMNLKNRKVMCGEKMCE